MLQRLPLILATTASSYGISFDPERARRCGGGDRRRVARDRAPADKPMAQR
jgi:hypothetical protein